MQDPEQIGCGMTADCSLQSNQTHSAGSYFPSWSLEDRKIEEHGDHSLSLLLVQFLSLSLDLLEIFCHYLAVLFHIFQLLDQPLLL